MRKVMLVLISILAGCVLSGVMPARASDAKIYVALFTGDGVAVVDPSSLDTWGVIKTGRSPVKLVASNDGKYIYVSVYGEDKVAAIDTATDKVVKSVKVGKWPAAMDLTPDGSRLLIGCMGDNSVSVIDTAEFKEVGGVKTLDVPNEVRITPDGKEAYVVNDTQPMQIFDLASLKQTGTVDMPINVNQLVISKSGGQVYYNSTDEKKVTIMDRATGKAIISLDAGVEGLALSQDGSELWFGGPGGVIRVYSFVEKKVVAELPQVSGFTNIRITFSQDGKRVLAGPAGEDGNTVNVYDAVKKEKTGEIKLPASPYGMLYITK